MLQGDLRADLLLATCGSKVGDQVHCRTERCGSGSVFPASNLPAINVAQLWYRLLQHDFD